MRLSYLKSVLFTPALRKLAISAICIGLQVGQTFASNAGANSNGVPVFEDMKVPRWLAETVVRAAQVTDIDPAYMMALADKESRLLPDNKNRASSAAGLFQFIESTWLEVLWRYGSKHG